MKRRSPKGRTAVLIVGSEMTRQVRLIGNSSLPATMCLDRNYDESIAIITDLRSRTRSPIQGRLLHPTGRRGGRIRWIRNYRDFTPLKSISAGAALMLAAEYDRVRRLSGAPPTTIDIDRWDPDVKATLAGLGFFKLLGLKVDAQPSDRGLLIEPMVSGSDVDMTPVNSAIAAVFQKGRGDLGLRVQLASAVTDAVENVRGHAYPREWFNPMTSVPLWWFTGAVDQSTGLVTLAIYDQGISIPKALPLKWDINLLMQRFRDLFTLNFDASDPTYDGQAIDMAMQLAASSTGLPYRGKGLPKILEIIRSCPSGKLRVVSRSGECIYGANGTKVVRTHQVPLLGTYLELEALPSAHRGQS
ncbi:hypothetical protein [Bradyrhizobium sp. CCGUVB23]|uniref:hypothetical protein n=1 Tax=Bradyrhizobium sp. CCGUVB23 TaxID=2949630 RepID=UPI0020B1BB38|nr:hypothetical protein [Bradyrhizobium sp. CCGUVB23]MCP3467990.1 hypothetical protein [Bradyrhizobium sp. CCGUVB23]